MSFRPPSSEENLCNVIAQRDLEYHSSQFGRPYRSTVHLAAFIESLVARRAGQALDIGCGAGANIYHLSRMVPGYRWTGVDLAGDLLFPIGRERFSSRGMDVDLVVGDFEHVRSLFSGRRFDLVVIVQAVMVAPDWERLLDEALAVTGGWLFLNSLFTDFLVDAYIEVVDHTWPAGQGAPDKYNVFSVDRIRAFCEARGCKEFITQDFEIDVDLEAPGNRGMGTYTRRLADGRRLQLSGPLLLPWKFVGIRMGEP